MKMELRNIKFIMQNLKCKTVLLKAFCILNFTFFIFHSNAQNINWTEVAPGVWKGIVGKPENYDLLKAAGVVPNKDALAKMGTTKFPLSQQDITGKIVDGKAALRFPLDKNEQIFGFGLNFQ